MIYKYLAFEYIIIHAEKVVPTEIASGGVYECRLCDCLRTWPYCVYPV